MVNELENKTFSPAKKSGLNERCRGGVKVKILGGKRDGWEGE